MRIVDPHIHIWDLATGLYPHFEKPSTGFSGSNAPIARSYLLDELRAEGGGEIDIAKAVNVEAFPTDPLKESAYLQALSDYSGFPLAIVGAADLASPDADALLAAQLGFKNMRGIRQVVNRHPNPLYNYVSRDFMDDPVWRANVASLGRRGLSFDLQLYPHQFDSAARVIAASPETVFIVNHAGMFADRTLAGWRQWRDGLRTLARFENVNIKISGLGMFDVKWTLESIRPYALEVLDAFGAKRAMFASNFPVDKLFGTYIALWRAFQAIVADFGAAEREALFAGNAERIYRF